MRYAAGRVAPGIPLSDFSGHVIEKKHLFGIEAEAGGGGTVFPSSSARRIIGECALPVRSRSDERSRDTPRDHMTRSCDHLR
jgi:hypothetical protein